MNGGKAFPCLRLDERKKCKKTFTFRLSYVTPSPRGSAPKTLSFFVIFLSFRSRAIQCFIPSNERFVRIFLYLMFIYVY